MSTSRSPATCYGSPFTRPWGKFARSKRSSLKSQDWLACSWTIVSSGMMLGSRFPPVSDMIACVTLKRSVRYSGLKQIGSNGSLHGRSQGSKQPVRGFIQVEEGIIMWVWRMAPRRQMSMHTNSINYQVSCIIAFPLDHSCPNFFDHLWRVGEKKFFRCVWQVLSVKALFFRKGHALVNFFDTYWDQIENLRVEVTYAHLVDDETWLRILCPPRDFLQLQSPTAIL